MDLASLAGGVAVITGSATGLGLAVAKHAAGLGMHICLSDLREDVLAQAVQELEKQYPKVKVAGSACDVTKRASLSALAKFVEATFNGAPVRYLGANAGVLFPASTVLTGSQSEWEVTMNVNVLGAVNTLQAFVPGMLAHGKDCVVVNTASMAGVVSGYFGPYGTSKHACVAVAEALHHELDALPGGDRVRIHVLCPGIVKTPLMYSSKEISKENEEISAIGQQRANDVASANAVETYAPAKWEAAMTPEHVASALFEGIRAGSFYVVVGQGEQGQARLVRMIKKRCEGLQAEPSYHLVPWSKL